jgi:hypothetical protein
LLLQAMRSKQSYKSSLQVHLFPLRPNNIWVTH